MEEDNHVKLGYGQVLGMRERERERESCRACRAGRRIGR